MRKVLIGGAPPVPLSGYWPSQEMMPKPIRYTGSHCADFQSSGGRCGSKNMKMPIRM